MKNKKLRKASGGMAIKGDFYSKQGIDAKDNSDLKYVSNRKVKVVEKTSATSLGVQLAIPG